MKNQKLRKVYDVVCFNAVPANIDLSKCTDKGVLSYFNKRSVVATCNSKRMAQAVLGLQGGRRNHSYEIVERTVKRK